ncbi:MAG TPA: hypothetical protein VGK49_04465 [Ilumatobacteraceae bacterium]
MGFNNYAPLDIFTASDADEIMRQTVMKFPDAATRDSEIGAEVEQGMLAYTTDDSTYWRRTAAGAWVPTISEWTSFTSLDNGVVGTDMDIGNGTFVGRYKYTPDGIRIVWSLTFGSSSALTGDAAFALPNSTTAHASIPSYGKGIYFDSGAPRNYPLTWGCNPGETFATAYHAESGNEGVVDQTNPFAFDENDIMRCDIVVAI